MKILITIYFLFRIFIFGFSRNYFSEVFLSFSPYIVVFDIIAIFIFVMFYLNFGQNIKQIFKPGKSFFTRNNVSFFIFCIILLFQVFVFVENTKKITLTYSQIKIENNVFQKGFSGLTVFYANIHIDNITYTGLVEPIKKHNPDVVAFVEYSLEHQKLLKDFWKKNYPYSNMGKYGIPAGNIIFSKYPIQDLADTANKKMRRFGYISVKKNDKFYFIYLVHTASPGSYFKYKLRNDQLKYFAGVVKNQKKVIGQNQSLIIGDFNISPRSPFYSDFKNSIGKEYKNVSTTIPLTMTWGLMGTPFPKVHIDHIFMSKSKNLKSIKKFSISGIKHNGYIGSDHDGFVFQID